MFSFLRDSFGCCLEPPEDEDGLHDGAISGIGFAREDLFGTFSKDLSVVPHKRVISEIRSLLLAMLPYVPSFFPNPSATTHNCEQLAAALDALVRECLPHLTSSQRPAVIMGCLPALENREAQEFVAEVQRLLTEVVRAREIDRTGQGITIFVAQLFAANDAEPLPTTNVKLRNDGYALLNEIQSWITCDRDRSGAISSNQMTHLFHYLNAGFSKLGRQRTLRIFDDSGNGALEWLEYHQLYSVLTTMTPLRDLFLQLLGNDDEEDDEYFFSSRTDTSMLLHNHNNSSYRRGGGGRATSFQAGASTRAVTGSPPPATAASFRGRMANAMQLQNSFSSFRRLSSHPDTGEGGAAAGGANLLFRHRSALQSAISGQKFASGGGAAAASATRTSATTSSPSSGDATTATAAAAAEAMSMMMGGLNDLDHLRSTKIVQRHREEALASRNSLVRFLRERQLETTDAQLRHVFDMMGPPHPPANNTSASSSALDRVSRREGYTFTQVQHYLTSHEANGWRDPHDVTFHENMSQPLCHYFINSSHNTYLNGKQFFDWASLDMYDLTLREGCRCVEIDCWNGSDGEPIVTHGHAGILNMLTFRAVIEVVNRSAFLTSPYPVILSLEVHTDDMQQTKMARIMEEVFGDRLVRAVVADKVTGVWDPAYTPEALKHKILVKGKYKAPPKQQQQHNDDDDYDGGVAGAAASPSSGGGGGFGGNSDFWRRSSELQDIVHVDYDDGDNGAAGASGVFDENDPRFERVTSAVKELREKMRLEQQQQQQQQQDENAADDSGSASTTTGKLRPSLENAEFPSVSMAFAAEKEEEEEEGEAGKSSSFAAAAAAAAAAEGDDEDDEDEDEEVDPSASSSKSKKNKNDKKNKKNKNDAAADSSSSAVAAKPAATTKSSGGGHGHHKVAVALAAVTYIRATVFKIEMIAGNATRTFPVFGVTSKSEEVPAKWCSRPPR